ncbi:MAG: amidohydrolase family protein [Planctomycetota bacterium]
MRTSHLALSLAALAAAPFAVSATGSGRASTTEGRDYVAVKAGTIYLVEDGQVVTDGTILVQGNRIQAVGTDVAVPVDAKVVDYGADAVIIPGLVAADTTLGSGSSSNRTAEPGLNAIDNFDFYSSFAGPLSSGVTTAYVKPTDQRLIGGSGALVKLHGEDPERRTLRAPATVHGAIHSAARNAPGYWDPPVPATVDVGIGYEKPQLPKSPMGAIVALTELVNAARGGVDLEEEYGPYAAEGLREQLDAGVPWRITAETETEILALLDFASESGLPVVLDGASEAGYVSEEVAASGLPVVYGFPWSPNRRGVDRGKDDDARWPSYDVPAKLLAAGARVAISSGSTSDLLFAASAASQGKLDPSAALRSITLTPAEIYGVADRVGSIRAGKDADFVVLNAPPISLGATPIATWVDGDLAWDFATSGARGLAEEMGMTRDPRSGTVALQVDQLYLGDGRVLSPGQVVMRNGHIISVTEGASSPPGATIVRGAAAMPGIVDAMGHLGLEGSSRVPGLDTRMAQILAPGDAADRRVARAGVTTVAMAPRGTGSAGSPVMAYKPAAHSTNGQVLGDPAAVRLQWTDSSNRRNSGVAVRGLLEKAKEYVRKWEEYEEAMANWTPPPPEPPKEDDEDEDDEEDDDDDKKDDDEDDDKKKKKKKKKKDDEEEVEPDPVTGIWLGELEGARLRAQLKLTVEEGGGPIEGNLRCAALTDGLVEVAGFYDAEAKSVSLKGLGSNGWVAIEGEYSEAKLKGTASVGETSMEVELERTSRDFVVAKRSERRADKSDDVKPPKGMPKAPRRDQKLEPLKAAMEGSATVIVNVDRDDEILECVELFEECGITPVLYGASSAYVVADHIVGRVAGVLLSHTVRQGSVGTDTVNPYARLQDAGIPVAFHSAAEEGAIDLPIMAMYAVANGMSPTGALRALTSDAADMLSISEHVGLISVGRDGDVLLLDGPPLSPGTSVVRVWVNGVEVE